MPGPRRRYVTIMFCDLCDSTGIAGTMEAEDYADLLGALRVIQSVVVTRHGGQVARIDGDGMTILFGHPEPHEDDGRRAVEAALDIHAAARRLSERSPNANLGIRLHTGVHSGMALMDTGDLERGRYEMLGDATNVARRLADLAGPDEILVSEATLGAQRHFFRTGERRRVTPRGKGATLSVFSVVGRETTETRFAARTRRGLAPFVGRGEALARLEAWRSEAAAGVNRLGVVVGDAGLGKTRLVNEFLARASAAGRAVHRAYCEAYLGARPLQPFLQLLRSVLEDDAGRGRLDAGLAGRLAALTRLNAPPGGAAAPSPAQAADMLRELFHNLAQAGPVMLFIDDWQWADDLSRQALDRILEDREGGEGGLLILLATRKYDALEAWPRDVGLISLEPFTPGEIEATVGAMLRAPEPFLVHRIADHSGGNPLFIEELCHSLARGEGEPGPRDRGGWLDVLIQSRFARLPEDQAELVRAASVIGHMVPVWLFEEITGRAHDSAAVMALEARDFIYQSETPGVLRFKHGLTRDAIYHTVGLRERRALHLRVVQALSRRAAGGEEDPCEALAYHYEAGGDPARAAHWAERAGDKAMSVSALDRAQAQYRAALTALGALGPAPRVLERWDELVNKFGRACVVDPSRDQLPVLIGATGAARARDDPAAVAGSELWLGYIYYGLGEARKAIAHCGRALEAATRIGDPKLAARVRAALGEAHATACEYTPALALLDEAITLRARHFKGVQPSIGLAYSRSCKAFVLADQGRFEAAHAMFDEAMAALCGETLGTAASILAMRGAACLWQGRLDDAARHADEAQRVAERVKARYLFSMSRALGAYARWRADGDERALRSLVEATAWLEASDSRQFLSLNHGWLTEAMVETGDLAAARRHAARALRRARQGDRLGEAMALRALARAAAAGAGRRPARVYLARATASAEARQSAHEWVRARLCAAAIAQGRGDAARAAALIDQARPALAAMGMAHLVTPAAA
jgi:class 3 adenylate cyclase/tetratricopeptide (TPR) repeat protein